MHKVTIIDNQDAEDSDIRIILDGNKIEGVLTYSVVGQIGERPQVSITFTAEEFDLQSKARDVRTAPFEGGNGERRAEF